MSEENLEKSNNLKKKYIGKIIDLFLHRNKKILFQN